MRIIKTLGLTIALLLPIAAVAAPTLSEHCKDPSCCPHCPDCPDCPHQHAK